MIQYTDSEVEKFSVSRPYH